MRINEIDYSGPPPVDAYGGGGFRLGGVFHEGGLLLTPAGVSPWPVAGAPSEADFAAVIGEADAIDVLLIGMGAQIEPLDRAARLALEAAGIGAEVMSTASACRTYNVLLSEGRRVAAALIPV